MNYGPQLPPEVVDILVRGVRDGDVVPFDHCPERSILMAWLFKPRLEAFELAAVGRGLRGRALRAADRDIYALHLLAAVDRCLLHTDCRDHPDLGRECWEEQRQRTPEQRFEAHRRRRENRRRGS